MTVDVDERKAALENEQKITAAWLNHPLATSLLADFKAEEEGFVNLICERRIVDLATFFTHFEAVGHLRGLRYATQRIFERRDEIETELKELQ
jgi:hypothetical protein